MDLKKEKEISDIIQYFNRQVSNVLKTLVSKNHDLLQNNSDLDWVRRVTKIARDINPPLMLEKSMDKLWDNKDAIIARDINFFKQKEVISKYIKNDCRKEWMESMISFIEHNIDILDEDEYDYLWKCINNMLQAVIRYRIVKDDFQK